ncbi:MAG: hemagglutinin repeat-containing protein, partial [Succiniclasticum sp.]|nr:hemagglutinin repeat-containing protein [Succiniclasticum sp.]
NLLSSNSITRDNTLIKAGRDITSAVDTSLKKTEYTRTFTGSGIRSGGFFGIQIGRWSETHTSASESTQPVPTTITSTHGKVDLDAEGRIHATTTYIYGKDGVTLSGADILLDGSQAKHKYSQTDAYRFKGLSAGLGGRAMKKLHDAYVFSGNALRARDKRLAVLEGLEAGKSWKEAKDYWNQEGKKGLTISVALTQEKQQQKYDSIIVRYEGGKIGSDKEIVLRVADLKNGQVKLIGQTLSGKEIRLETYKVDLEAGKNTTESHSENQSSGGHVGADIGSHSFTPDIGFNAARGKSTEQSESWTPTLLNGNLVSIEAGGDLHIDGSFVMGKKVDVNVGGDLKISSRQNSYTYHAKNSAIGGGVSLKSGGGSLSKDRTEYSLQTVAEQAGIFAGKEGLKVNEKGKTTLLGAVLEVGKSWKEAKDYWKKDDKKDLTIYVLCVF